jgi:hypothetical protein
MQFDLIHLFRLTSIHGRIKIIITRKHHYDARETDKIYHEYRLTAILFYKLLPKSRRHLLIQR